MKKFISHFFLFVSISLLSACVTNPTLPSNKDPQIQSLEAQVKENNDPRLIGELADAYYKDFEKTKNPASRQQALKYYQQFLKSSPEHAGVQVAIYSLMLGDVFDQKTMDLSRYAELEKMFESSEIIRRNNMASPSYIKALWLLQRSRNDNDLKTVMTHTKESIKENPKNPSPYILMSELQSHFKKDRLALATLRQAVRVSPDHIAANKALANYILDNAYAQHCVTQNPTQLNEAIKASKKVIKQDNNDYESHSNLKQLFTLLGRTKLSLHEAELVNKNKNDKNSKFELAYALFADQQLTKSEHLYLDLLKENPTDVGALSELAQLYSNSAQWEKADSYWKQFLENKTKPTLYDYLYYSHVISWRLGAEKSDQYFSLGTESLTLTNWEKKLRDYRLNKISENILLQNAENACEKTEAEFNIAYKHWLNNDEKSATKHFNNVVDLKVYPFREYIAAKQIMKLLNE